MPNPIEVLSLAEFERLLDAWNPARRITEVHVHCTDHPRHAEWRGRASVEAMRSFHRSIGMADIAQHLTIDPHGLIWTGRPFDARPASVRGHNGTPAAGPFMIEMVGLFEGGTDPFEGAQKNTAHAVVRAVLAKCGLDETAVKFHREFPNTGKTCPGLDLDPGAFRADIRQLLANNTLSAFDVPVPRRVTRSVIGPDLVAAIDLRPEPDYLEVPEHADAAAEQAVLTRLIEQGRLLPDDEGARGADEEFRDLIGHAVNTSQGILSGKGAMHNTTADLDALVRDHLTPQFESGGFDHLLFYAHGGLVGEKSALRYARAILPWWKSHRVYPIFFIWESNLFQTIWQRPRGPRGFGDFWDKGVELATQALARRIWSEMKANARRCSAAHTQFNQPGGLYELAVRLIPWLQVRNPQVQIHAVGHSTGPIVLAPFMSLLTAEGLNFTTLNYLAPAIRIDDFKRDVAPLVDGTRVKRLRIFTMSDKAERDDNVARIYRKSLLYYVRDACEDNSDGRILGLQKDLFDDKEMRAAFSLTDKNAFRAPADYQRDALRAIEFSQREKDGTLNERTLATTHGGFDNDQATMRSVLANVLDVADVGFGGERFPTQEQFERTLDPEDAVRALETEDDVDESIQPSACTCPCCHPQPGPVSAFDREDGDDDEDDILREDDRADADDDEPSGGRRLAVCIGIDTYPTMPLDGCVNDSRAWEERLEKAGFTVKTLRNRNATRARILEALTSLIDGSRRGDQLVFQYAGHGTQVPDLSGDEVDRFDEALVPFDYERGHLLIDDDIYEACARLRDRPGVTLTFFMDCCNSGTNTRVATVPRPGRNQNVRFLKLPPSVIRAYEAVRKRERAGDGVPPVSEREPQPGVVSFAACLDHEFAFEADGHGDFTTHAMRVFDTTLANGGSNQAFITAVVKAFGPSRRQNPTMINPAPGLKRRRFLGGR